jgi:hypothetical protein
LVIFLNFFLNVSVTYPIKCKEEKKQKTKKNRVKWDRGRGQHFSLQRLNSVY